MGSSTHNAGPYSPSHFDGYLYLADDVAHTTHYGLQVVIYQHFPKRKVFAFPFWEVLVNGGVITVKIRAPEERQKCIYEVLMATDAKDLHSDEHSLSGSDSELAAGQIGDPKAKTDPFPATIVDPPQQSAPSAAEKVTEQLVEMTANGTR